MNFSGGFVSLQDQNHVNDIVTVKQVYAGINRNETDALLKFFAPDIVRVEPEGFPSSGIYRGLDQMKVHLAQGRSTWAEGSCEPEQKSSMIRSLFLFMCESD
ncbi:nuclear transport factor 2 family protein [Bdellovibrio sp. SKB1291214]|uniref:nuclear transport factor 2 family protein n=1 Tax=Bdellovibrio sp. SKB1291214 TaxID=1732569 RepID=UPI001C3DA1D7|nr:nuclear transport factor 2 family protein [Bdellovibrio sp. SKB1291214]UYL07233.1 nuclear transport factor 2 family protein [Bdellovibrio sp. SKB1291214]